MGNRKAREFAQKQADDADWNKVRNEPRSAFTDVSVLGIGRRRIQLLKLPAFDEGIAFEVRQLDTVWQLFRSHVVKGRPVVQLIGYESVPFATAELAELFAKVKALNLPIVPYLNDCGGADGVRYHLTVFGDLFSSLRFEWWEEGPLQWRPLVKIAEEMLYAFSAPGNS